MAFVSLNDRVILKIITLGVLLFFSLDLTATVADTTVVDTAKTEKRVNFVPIPYINYNRTGGFEFGAVPMAMYKFNQNDTISPPSLSGLVGKYTTKGNWVLLGFNKWFFNEDNWRLIVVGGYASNGFQFFTEYVERGGGIVNYNTEAAFFYSEVQRKIVGSLYGGILFGLANTETSFREGTISKTTKFRAIGFKLLSDTRDDKYYPYIGYLTNLTFTANPEAFANDFTSNRIELDYNRFFPMVKKRDVLAARLKVGVVLGDVAFEQHLIVGGTDIRGYTQGKYRGEQLYSFQAEYRWNLHEKISIVGFGGLATIAESINESNNGKILPGLGTGFRIKVLPKHNMNVGLDGAVGLDDWGIYFRIGESF